MRNEKMVLKHTASSHQPLLFHSPCPPSPRLTNIELLLSMTVASALLERRDDEPPPASAVDPPSRRRLRWN